MSNKTVDVLVIGSGIAGLMTAHLLADHLNVMIITKANVMTSNSSCAQGGMAAALSPQDGWQLHFADTLKAGQDHHNPRHVEMLVKRAPAIVETLVNLGVSFDRNEDGSITLGMEGAHQQRRIVHVNGDKTGRAFTSALIEIVKNRVTIQDYTMVSRLVTNEGRVIGVETEDEIIYANATVLATGGMGQLYSHTSNVEEATGDGFALAYRAGAQLTDMEFIQFHPTLLMKDDQTYGLISEAVRGEGAKLIDEHGIRIMDHHEGRELAPRDVVSREIHRVLSKGRNVYLDCTMIENFHERFPSLDERCERLNIDVSKTPLQVVPGAHFVSGGIETNSVGETTLPGLYAVGEVACTGVHGANRLASNSLLEGLVFSEQVATHILTSKRELHLAPLSEAAEVQFGELHLPTKIEIQKRMTANVGIERELKGLLDMKRWLHTFLPAIPISSKDDRDTLERKNMILVACLITEAAIQRTESRGGHYRSDFLNRDDQNWIGQYITFSKKSGVEVVDRGNEQEVAMQSL
ncbi:L-aspartate oxidase [Halalkalibacter kiskunsagensis]|uniref:L-aspartate oxidase n=1 Tax=Halalkalibacter kiskunsagensis TaxID=1548599 RepID=A0ABV6KK01_9BACI